MASRVRTRWLHALGSALLAATALSACSVVPSSGPTRSAVVAQGATVNAPFLLVPISDFAIERLAKFPGPSLYGKFGDYRGALEQRVGVGDTVTVNIFEAAGGGLFSQPVAAGQTSGSHSAVLPPQVVQRDGSITVPYAGRVEVNGKTTTEISKIIVERLTGKAIEPQIVVSLSKNLATSVTVTGEAVAGARVPLTAAGDRILDLVAEAGGITTPASETFVDLTRGNKTVRVPYQTLLNDPKENIFARPGDTLTLVRYPLTFTAVGATSANSVVPFSAIGISLAEAVGKASGILDTRADPEGVFVFRYEPVSVVKSFPGLTPKQAALNLVPVVYLINMRDPSAMFLAQRFAMHDKDILFVSNSPFSDIQKLFAIFNTISSPLLQGISLGTLLSGGNGNALTVVSATSAASAASANAASASTAATTAGVAATAGGL